MKFPLLLPLRSRQLIGAIRVQEIGVQSSVAPILAIHTEFASRFIS
jgi:hypothetical protein